MKTETKKEKNLIKRLERKEKQREKHLKNLESLKKREYYNEKKDNSDIQNYYKEIKKSLNYQTLHNLIHSTYKPAKRRENIFSKIDRHPDYTLRCIFTNKTLEDKKGEKKIQKIDEEHIMPQSFQSGSKSHCGRDMHQIFACTKKANQNRGNKNFGNFGEFIKNDFCGKIYLFKGKKNFEPYFNQGAIARALLYVLVCYQGAVWKEKFPRVFLEYAVKCCSENEVSLWEKHRNSELFRLQGNRNPFIDFPIFAKLVNFEKGFR